MESFPMCSVRSCASMSIFKGQRWRSSRTRQLVYIFDSPVLWSLRRGRCKGQRTHSEAEPQDLQKHSSWLLLMAEIFNLHNLQKTCKFTWLLLDILVLNSEYFFSFCEQILFISLQYSSLTWRGRHKHVKSTVITRIQSNALSQKFD